MPFIENRIDELRSERVFSIIDLKNKFFHMLTEIHIVCNV